MSFDRRDHDDDRSPLRGLLTIFIAFQAVRRMAALLNQLRVLSYLRQPVDDMSPPLIPLVVVLPMLDESEVFDETVRYFRDLVAGGQADLYVVTSDREFTINERGSARDTASLAAAAAVRGELVHVHVPDVSAHKSDQVNLAATVAARRHPATDNCLVVIYDVDSRPDVQSLRAFRAAASEHPEVNVFHQSARFEMRAEPRTVSERIADAGALRANRFVLSMEIPRLLARRPGTGGARSWCAGWSYGKVAGHGLCVRLSYLLQMPLPARRTMEDMHWSFVLSARRETVIPMPCLDSSDVPTSAVQQYHQMERWFLGPARAVTYARDPSTPPGARRVVIAAGALAESAEWLSAAFALPAIGYAVVGRKGPLRSALRVFSAAVLGELVATEAILGEGHLGRRAQRVALYPFSVTAFGVAGWRSIASLIAARPQRHKTGHAPRESS